MTMMERKEKRDRDIVMSEENMLSVVEVARYLHVHPSTIYRLVKGNELQGFKVGRDWRFNVEDIDRIGLSQETVGARRRATVYTPPRTRLPPDIEAMSSESPDAEPIAAENKEAMKRRDSLRSRFSASHHESKMKPSGHPDEAQEDQNEMSADLSSGESPESMLTRMLQLEEENRRLRMVVADQALDIQLLKEVLHKRFVR
jgi:excisionase family DNA binding protein